MRKRDFLYLIFGLVIVVIGLTFLFNFIIIYDSTLTIAKDSNWISYFGGIISGVISGFITIIGVWFTLKYYIDKDREEKVLRIQPYLRITDFRNSNKSFFKEVHFTSTFNNHTTDIINIEMQNIGLGPAVDINFKVFTDNNKGSQDSVINLVQNEIMHIAINYGTDGFKKPLELLLAFKDIHNNDYEQKFIFEKIRHTIKVLEIGKPKRVN